MKSLTSRLVLVMSSLAMVLGMPREGGAAALVFEPIEVQYHFTDPASPDPNPATDYPGLRRAVAGHEQLGASGQALPSGGIIVRAVSEADINAAVGSSLSNFGVEASHQVIRRFRVVPNAGCDIGRQGARVRFTAQLEGERGGKAGFLLGVVPGSYEAWVGGRASVLSGPFRVFNVDLPDLTGPIPFEQKVPVLQALPPDTQFLPFGVTYVLLADLRTRATKIGSAQALSDFAKHDDKNNFRLEARLEVLPDPCQVEVRTYIDPILKQPNDQASINVGDSVSLRFLVGYNNTGPTIDMTNDPSVRFFTDPPRGIFTSKNVWRATAADANKAFPIYGVFTDPATGLRYTSLVHIYVRPN